MSRASEIVATILKEREAKQRPFRDRIAQITRKYDDWFRREQERPGATLEGAAPQAVNDALETEQRNTREAAVQVFASHEAELRAAGQQLVAEADAKYAAAVAAFDALREFERDYRTAARDCHAPGLLKSLDEPALSSAAYAEWTRRVDSVLAPRPAAPSLLQRAWTNALDLASVD